MFERVRYWWCWWHRGGHEWAYTADLNTRRVWFNIEVINAIRDETANPHDQHPLKLGQIGHFYGIPLYKRCRHCGRAP